ncbi:MAG: hypothetical protein HYX59_10675 [Elusimicrobia bacterium]|nr:hypothetical protein [Elusimicrobiota bacterium]
MPKKSGLVLFGLLIVVIVVVWFKMGGLEESGNQILRRVTLTEESIPGTYVAKYSFGMNTFVVAADRTFTQEAEIVSQNRILRSSGTWEYDSRYGVIIMKNGLGITNGDGALSNSFDTPGILTYAARRRFWSQRQYIGGDTRFVHEKKD